MLAEITRGTILREMQELAWHNVLCCSKNYLMDEPKEGLADQWAEARAKAQVIDQMVAELPVRSYDEATRRMQHFRRFKGTITGWGGTGQHIDRVSMEIEGTSEGFGRDVRDFGASESVASYLRSGRYDTERHARYGEGKGHTVIVTVDEINHIQSIDWAEEVQGAAPREGR